MSTTAPTGCFIFAADCQCDGMEDIGCICPREERALRSVIAGKAPPLSEQEREWCCQQIIDVEGYDERDAVGSDADLARTVLAAWMDYCRDKGLL